jgi:hypothetical protein
MSTSTTTTDSVQQRARKRSSPVSLQQKPFNEDLVFEPDHRIDYDEFAQLITTSPKLLGMVATSRVLPPPDLDALGTSLVKLSTAIGSTPFMLDCLLNLEFDKAYSSSQSVILRGNSLTTKVMDQLVQVNSIEYLKKVLVEPLKKVLVDESLSLEVDKTKMMETDDEREKDRYVEQNIDLLKQHTSTFLDNILQDSSVQEMPYECRTIARTIKKLSDSYQFDAAPLLGSYIMLR